MRRTALLVTTVLVLAAGIAYAALGPAGKRPGPEPRRGGPIAAISGELTGLYPGRETELTARVANRARHTLWLHSIRARPRSDGGACPAELVRVRRRQLHREIPAGGRIRVGLRVTLAGDAPNACQGATWPLRFHARVSRRSGIGP